MMRSFLITIFGFLMSWWGLWLLAALDSTMVFFLPFGIDIAIIIRMEIGDGAGHCDAGLPQLQPCGLVHVIPEGRIAGRRRRDARGR